MDVNPAYPMAHPASGFNNLLFVAFHKESSLGTIFCGRLSCDLRFCLFDNGRQKADDGYPF
jgi:hypothetical protein